MPSKWLKISVTLLIGLGIFFRFGHLDQKSIWFDETFTLLAISGHTVAEVQQDITNKGILPITVLDQYQHLNPDRNVNDTIRYLMTSDPQHPPLYYGLARLWTQVFGDSLTGVRSLSAVISLLVFPSAYWLCLELFESSVVGWVAMALMAVSPLEVFFAQDARQYGLWIVTILVSSAALLRTLRRETWGNWSLYCFTLIIGLYTHLLTVFVAIAHGIYVLCQQRFYFNKTLRNYLLSISVGFLVFTPWIFILIKNLSLAQKLTSFLSLLKLNNLFDLIVIILAQISRIFFDLNLDSYLPWIHQSFLDTNQVIYSLISGTLTLLLIFYILYFLLKQGIKQSSFFLIILGIFPFLCLLLPDLILGGVRSTIVRYQMPLYLSLQIAIAYILTVYILQEKKWQQTIGYCLIMGFLLAGLVSDIFLFEANTWWIQLDNKGALATANYINKFDNSLYLTSSEFVNIGSLLVLNHLLKSTTNILILQDTSVPIFLPETDNIFLSDDSVIVGNRNSLISQLKQQKNYSLQLVNEPLTQLWQVEKISK